MLTRGLSIIAALFLLAGAASAGELDLKPTLWSGFYVTAIGGGMQRDIHDTFRGAHTDTSNSEAAFGGALGFNGQWLNIVWSAEGDYQRSADGRYLETVRGRLGWSLGQFLFYGTAGIGWSKFNTSFVSYKTDSAAGKTLHTGFAYGGGAEWQLNQWLSIRSEVIAVEFDQKSVTSRWGNTLDQTAEALTYRLGVSYYLN